MKWEKMDRDGITEWISKVSDVDQYVIAKLDDFFVWSYRFHGNITDSNWAGVKSLRTAKNQCRRNADHYGLLTVAGVK